MGELKKVFRPELLNRIDEVIVFHKLTKEEIIQIVDLLMKRVREQMAVHEVAIELTRRGQGAARREGLRPGHGRPPAAPRDPAPHRRPARRLRAHVRARAGLDDPRRPQGRRGRGRHLGHRRAAEQREKVAVRPTAARTSGRRERRRRLERRGLGLAPTRRRLLGGGGRCARRRGGRGRRDGHARQRLAALEDRAALRQTARARAVGAAVAPLRAGLRADFRPRRGSTTTAAFGSTVPEQRGGPLRLVDVATSRAGDRSSRRLRRRVDARRRPPTASRRPFAYGRVRTRWARHPSPSSAEPARSRSQRSSTGSTPAVS